MDTVKVNSDCWHLGILGVIGNQKYRETFPLYSGSQMKDKDKLWGRNLPAGSSVLGQRRCYIPGPVLEKARGV